MFPAHPLGLCDGRGDNLQDPGNKKAKTKTAETRGHPQALVLVRSQDCIERRPFLSRGAAKASAQAGIPVSLSLETGVVTRSTQHPPA